ncbi:DUF2797 domain-containing protein [Kitasatospora sp. MAP5-34]|uniref:DUF2797 domain-containing protein n=1 Tax=Kitasatospora sp. MAP5-34 TaxID=3035102 RepID=UPI0024740A2E|nr:DUF2797 domain-containing protein [Kitasatospora sp. MAP5-34]MDH6574499.1 hypothetical protein [Kitasatospora sp. MAP5-34]
MAISGEAGQGWTATGLRWHDGLPHLTATNGRRSHERVVSSGTRVSWLVTGPRRCGGVRTSGGHYPCPYRAVVEPGAKAAQCGPCQGADLGLALARDQILDDGRTYRLYLAWFGEGLLKVGLTAEQRGTARLLEQAALAFTFVARGPLPAVRRAELTVAQAGLARERLTARVKTTRWWALPGEAPRRQELLRLRAAVLRLLDGHAVELLPDGPLADHVELFGLAGDAPPAYREIAALNCGATVTGTLRTPVGRHLFIDTFTEDDATGDGQDPPLLLDTRLLTGWTLAPAEPGPPTGLELRLCRQPTETAAQDALF